MRYVFPPLQFKGHRNYLHGTDIFNATLTLLQAHESLISNIDLSFHKLSRRQLLVRQSHDVDTSDPVAICKYKIDNEPRSLYLVESADPVTDRYPYPEEDIVSAVEFDLGEKTASLSSAFPYTDIEIWVAMTKALHLGLYPDNPGKWLFVRGRFPEYSKNLSKNECMLKLSANFSDKLTRSDVFQDGQKLGEIFFSIA